MEVIRKKIDEMVGLGVDILDIGGQSTKPGSLQIEAQLEMDRVAPAIAYAAQAHPQTWISVDTTRASVLRVAVEQGALIANDISAGNMDPFMLQTVADLAVPYICMHMQGTPETMQQDPRYGDVTQEVVDFFRQKIHSCHALGIREIILDPGFGFGKTMAHNYQLIRELERIVELGYPTLVGVSRKSMIYKLLSVTPEEALNGTTVLNTVALMKGASILRVHDVREALEVVKILDQLNVK